MNKIYHVWFATKERKHVLLGDVAEAAKESIIKAAREHGIDLLECETMPDHVHMLLQLEDMSLVWAMKLLKGRSAYEVLRRFPELKLDAHTNALWQRGYGAKPVPEAALATVRHYIRTQDERLEKYDVSRLVKSRGF